MAIGIIIKQHANRINNDLIFFIFFIFAYILPVISGIIKFRTIGNTGIMHAYIRNLLNEKYDASIANSVPIIYGGSVKPSNASSIFAQPDVDGGLIGGSSLKADDFLVIIQSTWI